jgi:ABC-type lipoprotein release transport system permease subunit
MKTNTKILKYGGIGLGMIILLGGLYYFNDTRNKDKNEYIKNSMNHYGISYKEAEEKWNEINATMDKEDNTIHGGKKNKRSKKNKIVKNKTRKNN